MKSTLIGTFKQREDMLKIIICCIILLTSNIPYKNYILFTFICNLYSKLLFLKKQNPTPNKNTISIQYSKLDSVKKSSILLVYSSNY